MTPLLNLFTKLADLYQSVMVELAKPSTQAALTRQFGEHLSLSLTAIGLAILFAVPLGVLLTRFPRFAEPVMSVVGLLQTLPSLALLAFMVPILGIGRTPALAALFLYALLPILRNTYTGIREVSPGALEAGRGMGMTSLQMLFMVEMPLAMRVIMSGVRVSTVLIIGWATLAGFIGGGGLGEMILTGFALVKTSLVIIGGVPVTVMALLSDFLLGRLENALTPRGLQA